jgi:multidrug efflux pump subunit AcrA (membrane-fusion protein)
MFFDELKTMTVALAGPFLLGFAAVAAAQHPASGLTAPPPRGSAFTERNQARSTLQLVGSTDYDPETVANFRMPVHGRVDRIFVELGSTVKIGDSLLELSSSELAEARSQYERATSDWLRDKAAVSAGKSNNDTSGEQNKREYAEALSLLEMKLAGDKLRAYGLSDNEIANTSERTDLQKEKLTLRSLATGEVV